MADAQPEQPLHVVLVIDQLTYDRLGPVITHLSVGLLDFVSPVTLVTPAEAALRLSLGPVRVIQHGPLHWPLWESRFRSIVDELAQSKPTVIHAFSHRSFRLGDELAVATGCPLVGHLLGAEDLEARQPGGPPHLRALIAASEPLFEEARRRQLLKPEHITLVRPGLLTGSTPTCFTKEDMVPTLLCMSAFERETNIETLIKAVRILVDHGDELMLFLLGQGPTEKRLRRLVENEGLIKHVTFGLPITEWTSPMQAADLFVVPCTVRRVDVRLLYALASGMAAVACSTPNSDFLIHNKTGLVCEEPTASALAGAIRRLLEDRPLARRLAASALAYCKQFHSLSMMADKTATVYRKVRALPR